MERLIDLLDFGLHQEFHVQSDLAAASGDEPEEATGLGNTVADGVPGDRRHSEVELLH